MRQHKMQQQNLIIGKSGSVVAVVFFVIAILVVAFLLYHYRNTPTSAVKTNQLSSNTLQQIAELGEPTVTPFLPKEEFTVVENSEGRIAIANGFANFPLTTIMVKRMEDGAIFRVATEFLYDSSVKVKIFKIFWKQNFAATNAGFLLALPLGKAAQYSQPLTKNPK